MASWKQINEAGGTIVLRFIAGLFAALALYGFVKVLLNGNLTLAKATTLLSFVALMGGYAVFGNRLRARDA